MTRDIIFEKNVGLANALLKTGKCKNLGHWVLRCDDNIEDMKILQKACSEYLADAEYKGVRKYKLLFAESGNYNNSMLIE